MLSFHDYYQRVKGTLLRKATGDNATLERLRAVARTIKHCGDYGYGYLKPATGVVWWVCADSDSPQNGYTGTDEIRRRLSALPGVARVIIESETSPPAQERIDGQWVPFGREASALEKAPARIRISGPNLFGEHHEPHPHVPKHTGHGSGAGSRGGHGLVRRIERGPREGMFDFMYGDAPHHAAPMTPEQQASPYLAAIYNPDGREQLQWLARQTSSTISLSLAGAEMPAPLRHDISVIISAPVVDLPDSRPARPENRITVEELRASILSALPYLLDADKGVNVTQATTGPVNPDQVQQALAIYGKRMLRGMLYGIEELKSAAGRPLPWYLPGSPMSPMNRATILATLAGLQDMATQEQGRMETEWGKAIALWRADMVQQTRRYLEAPPDLEVDVDRTHTTTKGVRTDEDLGDKAEMTASGLTNLSPPWARALYAAYGGTCTLSDRTAKEIAPTQQWPIDVKTVAGWHSYDERRSYLTSVAWLTTTRVALHEMGHGLDHALGGLFAPAGPRANMYPLITKEDPAWGKIFRQYKRTTALWPYMRKNAQEMFAEGYALYCGIGAMGSRRTLEKDAPNIVAYFDNLHARILDSVHEEES